MDDIICLRLRENFREISDLLQDLNATGTDLVDSSIDDTEHISFARVVLHGSNYIGNSLQVLKLLLVL